MNTLNSQIKSILSIILILHTAKAQQDSITESQAWGYGMLTGFLLSALGFVAAILLICQRKCFSQFSFKMFMGMLYALACGALLGDSTLHILPDAYLNEATDFRMVTLILILSILFFIMLERVFQTCGGGHKHWAQDGHLQKSNRQQDQGQHKKSELHDKLTQNQDETNSEGSNEEKGTAGYLNIMSSFLHNFMDGLGIGISFASKDLAIITPMISAIVAHEILRELGDVGILLKNRFSNTQTVLCNGMINFMSLFGVITGLLVGSINPALQAYLLVFVAGNFIYIASDIWRNLFRQKWLYNVLQLIMFGFGIGSMYIVLLFQAEQWSSITLQMNFQRLQCQIKTLIYFKIGVII